MVLSRLLVPVLVLLGLGATAQARPLFVDGFDPPAIAPLFPPQGNSFALPPGPTVDRLVWLMGELAAGQTTTPAEVEANFDPAWLAQTNVAQTQAFIQSLRTSWPDAVIRDVVMVTPVRATVVISSPGGALPWGFMNIGARYSGERKIVLFGVSNYGGSVIYPADRTLTLPQAADRFATLSPGHGLLVGRIGANGQCTALAERNAQVPRATASVFKIFSLGAVGRMIADGPLSAAEPMALTQALLAPGGTINSEPLGTVFTVGEIATMMMGISDNTATDHLHARVGRTRMNQSATWMGMAQPTLITPFLNISEQFHVFRSFAYATALSYVNGTEPFQEQFLVQQIEPLGRFVSGPFFHADLLTAGTWQATAFDVCRAFGALRLLPKGSEAMTTVDAALGAGVAQPDVRGDFQRVWYKGGSLAQFAGQFHVLNHVWMLEDGGADAYVVIALSNDPGGAIDPFAVQSVTGRLLELVAERP
ncbi:MAG: serine hydrolase [Xanthomonadales bacterium]|nr:serine hydrolase [Xanthomonadales bacterium]